MLCFLYLQFFFKLQNVFRYFLIKHLLFYCIHLLMIVECLFKIISYLIKQIQIFIN
jgi:hypothetical protein